MGLSAMQMSEYLSEIQHAVSNTFELASSEHRQLEAIDALITRQAAEAEESARRVQWLVDNPDLDDDMLATSMYWESYFGPEKDLYYAKKSREFLIDVLEVRRFATGALNGSILQHAKQGISLVHSKLDRSPDGRSIGTQPFKGSSLAE